MSPCTGPLRRRWDNRRGRSSAQSDRPDRRRDAAAAIEEAADSEGNERWREEEPAPQAYRTGPLAGGAIETSQMGQKLLPLRLQGYNLQLVEIRAEAVPSKHPILCADPGDSPVDLSKLAPKARPGNPNILGHHVHHLGQHDTARSRDEQALEIATVNAGDPPWRQLGICRPCRRWICR